MAEQREVLAGRKTAHRLEDLEYTELDEVVPASARAELGPRPVLQARRHVAPRPVVIHHRVVAALLELGAHAESGFLLDGARQAADVARVLDDGALHAETEAEEWDAVLAGILDRVDLALDAIQSGQQLGG